MRCLTVAPGHKNSLRLDERPEPAPQDGWALIEAVALGVCGTDRDIIAGDYGWAPPGEIGWSSATSRWAACSRRPAGSDLAEGGDLVAGVVRRPDPVPCPACAVGEWDMCRNGQYTERGIKERDGYGAERYLLEPEFAIKIDPALGFPGRAAGAHQRRRQGLGPHRADRRPRPLLAAADACWSPAPARSGCWPRCSAAEGPERTSSTAPRAAASRSSPPTSARPTTPGNLTDLKDLAPDIVIECTGADAVVADAMNAGGPDSIVCLAGVSSGGQTLPFDIGGFSRAAVLANDVVFGSVNANLAHYQAAAEALAKADKGWLARLISRRVPLDRWRRRSSNRDDDVKVAIDFGSSERLKNKGTDPGERRSTTHGETASKGSTTRDVSEIRPPEGRSDGRCHRRRVGGRHGRLGRRGLQPRRRMLARA